MEKRFKIGICGHLNRTISGENGQTMKTISVSDELKKIFGESNVLEVSTHNWKKQPFKLFFEILKMSRLCSNIIMFPDSNGVRVILPLFLFLQKKHKNNLLYSVQGAWLPDLLKKKKSLKKRVNKLKAVLVETNTLASQLKAIGVNNCIVFKNFKHLETATDYSIDSYEKGIIKFCYFSRVTPEKGILDAITAIKKLSDSGVKLVFDIFGPCPSDFKKSLIDSIKEEHDIFYKGQIDAYESVNTIKNYHYQLFPTRYATEGIPGSIIDSFFSGVPVIASRWNSCFDILTTSYNSFVYELGDVDGLFRLLMEVSNLPYKDYLVLRKNCLKSAEEYKPSVCIQTIVSLMQ